MCSAAHLATSGSLMTTIGLRPNMICIGQQNIMHKFFQDDRACLCRTAQSRMSDYRDWMAPQMAKSPTM